MAFASAKGCELILANDPDADRLAVAEWDATANVWRVFSGNNLGVLLAHWQIMQYKERCAKGEVTSAKGAAVLTTVVSSRMLKAVAAAEGVTYSDTLTGFKWIGNRALELSREGFDVVFSYEEALGYCAGDKLCDKDGISAACVFAELKLHLAGHPEGPRTVCEHLSSLYKTYGEFVSYNSYVFCHDKQLTKQIFARLRSGPGDGGYWKECAGVQITSVHDITLGYDSTSADKVSSLPATPESEMLMFEFANAVSVTLRTSGTEPKIKFYTEIQGRAGDTTASLTEKLTAFVEAVIADMLQWQVHGLKRP
jgi:phosphoglucomutase/phosphoglucomutase/phosphopentomutase